MEFDKIVKKQYSENIDNEYGVIYGKDKVILIKTGQNGSIYGYENMYLSIAWYLNMRYNVSVVVSSTCFDGTDCLGQAVMVVREECEGWQNIYYMGHSNGAIIGARFGYAYPEIKRLLLINAPLMINWLKTKKGIEQYHGERVVFVYGKQDPSYKYTDLIKLISSEMIQLIIIEGADHNFQGMEQCFKELPERYLLGGM